VRLNRRQAVETTKWSVKNIQNHVDEFLRSRANSQAFAYFQET
jgi:hypothetical protein